MKCITWLLATLLPILSGAQSPQIKALTIGDTVPDVVFNHITNYNSSTAKLSDFRGKLVILDFWSSWCGTCISLFPYMDSLQKEFGNNIQIILVNTKSKMTKDDAPKINKIINQVRNYTGSLVEIPVVYNSEELDGYFPCIGIPHEVWINGDGKVVSITYAEEVTRNNIKSILEDKIVQMKLKKDLLDFNGDIPLFVNGNGGDGSQMKYRSMVSGYIDGVGSRKSIRQNDDNTLLCIINQSLYSLTKAIYATEIPFHDNRIILDVRNRKRFEVERGDALYFQNMFSYELIVPPCNDSVVHKYAQEDLERYFNISVRKELRSIRCLVVTAPHKLKEMKAFEKGTNLERSSLKKFIHNYPIGLAIGLLNSYTNTPLINDTHLNKDISIDLPFDLNNVAGLKEAFKKTGLELKEETMMINVIVITNK